jgi:hypothetical protein
MKQAAMEKALNPFYACVLELSSPWEAHCGNRGVAARRPFTANKIVSAKVQEKAAQPPQH